MTASEVKKMRYTCLWSPQLYLPISRLWHINRMNDSLSRSAQPLKWIHFKRCKALPTWFALFRTINLTGKSMWKGGRFSLSFYLILLNVFNVTCLFQYLIALVKLTLAKQAYTLQIVAIFSQYEDISCLLLYDIKF